jgi:hypothetical protein
MLLRHFGVFVQNIKLIDSILLQLGFECIYNEDENVNYKVCNVRKYALDTYYVIELIENGSRARGNSFHISIDGNVPDYMLQYRIEKFIPKDDNLLVDFVYINDSIYFEFVRNKNEL